MSPLGPFINPLTKARHRHRRCLRSVYPAIRSIKDAPHQCLPRRPSDSATSHPAQQLSRPCQSRTIISSGSFFRVCFCFYTGCRYSIERPSAVARLLFEDGPRVPVIRYVTRSGDPALGATPDQFPMSPSANHPPRTAIRRLSSSYSCLDGVGRTWQGVIALCGPAYWK